MRQQYQSASLVLGAEVVTLILVAHAAVSTEVMAKRSMAALMPRFPNSTVVLVANDAAGKPLFVGPKHLVGILGQHRLQDFRWAPILV